MTNVTVAANSAAGAILSGAAGVFKIRNTLLAEKPGTIAATGVIDDGHNLSATDSPSLSQATSRNNAVLNLGPLGDYGGPTPTIPLLIGSAAIDAGEDWPVVEFVDQRGHARYGAHADVGAFESSPPFHLFGTVNGYVNTTTAVTTGGSTIPTDANGVFVATVPAGLNALTFSATNTFFRNSVLNLDVKADMPVENRGFANHVFVFDPDLTDPSFTLAANPGESWQFQFSSDLITWNPGNTVQIGANGLTSVTMTNTISPAFVKVVQK